MSIDKQEDIKKILNDSIENMNRIIKINEIFSNLNNHLSNDGIGLEYNINDFLDKEEVIGNMEDLLESSKSEIQNMQNNLDIEKRGEYISLIDKVLEILEDIENDEILSEISIEDKFEKIKKSRNRKYKYKKKMEEKDLENWSKLEPLLNSNLKQSDIIKKTGLTKYKINRLKRIFLGGK